MLMEPLLRCDAAYKQTVLLKCYDALASVGFTRYRKEHVDWPLWDGFHGWIGLNTDLQKEYVQINPFVGVHVIPIMKFYTSIEGLGYRRSTATYALHVGLIKPKEPVFKFTRQTDIEVEASRLARLCSGAGLTYARSIASYEQLLPLLQERIPMLGAYPERVAACLYLMGRKGEARTFVENFFKDNRDYFEGFAVPFLKFTDESEARK